MAELKTNRVIASQETGAPGQVPEKKRYERPQIVYRAPLEAMAAVCPPPTGKAGALCTIPGS